MKITKSKLTRIIKEVLEEDESSYVDPYTGKAVLGAETIEGIKVPVPTFKEPENLASALLTLQALWNSLNELLVEWEKGRGHLMPGNELHDSLKEYQEQVQFAMKQAASDPQDDPSAEPLDDPSAEPEEDGPTVYATTPKRDPLLWSKALAKAEFSPRETAEEIYQKMLAQRAEERRGT